MRGYVRRTESYVVGIMMAGILAGFPAFSQGQAWEYPGRDARVSFHYPFISRVLTGDTLELKNSVGVNNVNVNNILTGDVTGNDTPEIVTVQDNRLYVINSNGKILVNKNIEIGDQEGRVSMIDDVNGDGIRDIGVAYNRKSSGGGKGRLYDGTGKHLKEFSRTANSKVSVIPSLVIDGEIMILYATGFGKDPRGFARWSFPLPNEKWYYDIGPKPGNTMSVADINNDGKLEITSFKIATTHNGASGTSGTPTDDDNMWLIVIDENGQEVFTRKYPPPHDGKANHRFIDFNNDGKYQIFGEEAHDPVNYQGNSQLHIFDGNSGNPVDSFTGLMNGEWSSSVCDINKDGFLEIVATNRSGNTYDQYVFDSSLTVLKQTSTKGEIVATGDLNGNGIFEIVLKYNDEVKVLDSALNQIDSYVFNDTVRNVIISGLNDNGINEPIVLTDSIHMMEFKPRLPVLSGKVTADSHPLDQGSVELWRYDTSEKAFTEYDSALITEDDSGYYFFTGIDTGRYLIKTGIDTSSDLDSIYFPTYYKNAFLWKDADMTRISKNKEFYQRNIKLKTGTLEPGIGEIRGRIFDGGPKKRKGKGDPLGGVEVLLMDPGEGSPDDFTYTGSDGSFQFTGIALGDYEVIPEITGFVTKASEVNLTTQNPKKDSLDFGVYKKNRVITGIYYYQDPVSSLEVGIYPNPVRDQLIIEIHSKDQGSYTLKIANVTGQINVRQHLRINPGQNVIRLGLQNMNKGFYILKLEGKNGRTALSKKLFIQR